MSPQINISIAKPVFDGIVGRFFKKTAISHISCERRFLKKTHQSLRVKLFCSYQRLQLTPAPHLLCRKRLLQKAAVRHLPFLGEKA